MRQEFIDALVSTGVPEIEAEQRMREIEIAFATEHNMQLSTLCDDHGARLAVIAQVFDKWEGSDWSHTRPSQAIRNALGMQKRPASDRKTESADDGDTVTVYGYMVDGVFLTGTLADYAATIEKHYYDGTSPLPGPCVITWDGGYSPTVHRVDIQWDWREDEGAIRWTFTAAGDSVTVPIDGSA